MKKTMKQLNKIDYIVISSFFVVFLLITIVINAFPKQKTAIYEKNSLANSVEKVKDASVAIETYSGDALMTNGSGFIYKKGPLKAYVITNEHVIDGNRIVLYNANDKEVDAKLLGEDAHLDLAVLEIDAKDAPGVVTFGSSDDLRLGDTVFTVGSPISKRYQGSVSAGVLSGKDRVVQTLINETDTKEWLMNVLQFDASVSPGNSGGALFNANGEVVGVCTLKLMEDGVEGMSFAIPVEYVKANIELLEKGKELTWPELGISMADADDAAQLTTHDLELPDGIVKGAVVLKVKKDSNADGHLQKGDIITKIDNLEIKNTAYVKYALSRHKVGDKMKITYTRNKKEKTITITLK